MSLAFLSLCQREEGRQCLRALLRWEEFDDVGDLRHSIELDSVYSSIVFAVEKGLSWPAVVEAGKLAEELLNETKGVSVQAWKEPCSCSEWGHTQEIRSA
uniref:Uncharacterized protein n=1 Tax=Gopherus agassizii TaxID=38772 RepID=A0A452HM41_9SAUR